MLAILLLPLLNSLKFESRHTVASLSELSDITLHLAKARSCSRAFLVSLRNHVQVHFCPEDRMGVNSSAAFIFNGVLICELAAQDCAELYDLPSGVKTRRVVVKLTLSEAKQDRETEAGYYPRSDLDAEEKALSNLNGSRHAPRFFGAGLVKPRVTKAEPKALVMEYVGAWTLADYIEHMVENRDSQEAVIFQWLAGEILDTVEEQASHAILHTDLHFDNLMLGYDRTPHFSPLKQDPQCGYNSKSQIADREEPNDLKRLMVGDVEKAVRNSVHNPIRLVGPQPSLDEFPVLKAVDFNQVATEVTPLSKALAVARAAARLDAYVKKFPESRRVQLVPDKVNKARLSVLGHQVSLYLTDIKISRSKFLAEVDSGLSEADAVDMKNITSHSWLNAFLASINLCFLSSFKTKHKQLVRMSFVVLN